MEDAVNFFAFFTNKKKKLFEHFDAAKIVCETVYETVGIQYRTSFKRDTAAYAEKNHEKLRRLYDFHKSYSRGIFARGSLEIKVIFKLSCRRSI